jgi:hypothetical protein
MVKQNLPPKADAVPATPPAPALADPDEANLPTERDDLTKPKDTPPSDPKDTPLVDTASSDSPADTKLPVDPKDTPKSVPNQIYNRMNTAEETVKAYKDKFGDLLVDGVELASPSAPANDSDPIAIAKAARVLAKYDDAELEHLAIVAKGLGVSPVEAVQSESFQKFSTGHRDAIKKDNAVPAPSDSGGMHIDKTDKEIGEMSDEDFKALEKDALDKQNAKGI